MNRIIVNGLAAAVLMGAAAGIPRRPNLDVGSAPASTGTDADLARIEAAKEKRRRRNAKRAAIANRQTA